MSNFGGFFFQGQKKNLIFLKYCSIRTKKLPQMKVRKPKKYIFDIQLYILNRLLKIMRDFYKMTLMSTI